MQKNKGVDPKLKKLVRETIQRAQSVLNVSKFEIRVLYMDGPSISNEGCWADIHPSLHYLTADMRIYTPLIEAWDKKEEPREKFQEVVTHEVAHLVTARMALLADQPYKSEQEVIEAKEELTTIVGRMAYDLWHKYEVVDNPR